MDYLIYVAHDAETLQFYLWLKNYKKRYLNLRKEEQALSPEWQVAKQAKDRRLTHKKSNAGSMGDRPIMDKESAIRMTELSMAAKEVFEEPPMSPTATATDYESFITKSVHSQKTVQELAEDASQQAGLKWQPCKCIHPSLALLPLIKQKKVTCQPFRLEIAKVIAHYFAPGAPRELNLSHRARPRTANPPPPPTPDRHRRLFRLRQNYPRQRARHAARSHALPARPLLPRPLAVPSRLPPQTKLRPP